MAVSKIGALMIITIGKKEKKKGSSGMAEREKREYVENSVEGKKVWFET